MHNNSLVPSCPRAPRSGRGIWVRDYQNNTYVHVHRTRTYTVHVRTSYTYVHVHVVNAACIMIIDWQNHVWHVMQRSKYVMAVQFLASYTSLCSLVKVKRHLQMQTQHLKTQSNSWLMSTLLTSIPAISVKWRFHKLITVINFEPRIFSLIPTLILFLVSSAFCWYLTLAFKAFVALARVVTDTQTDGHTQWLLLLPLCMGKVHDHKSFQDGVNTICNWVSECYFYLRFNTAKCNKCGFQHKTLALQHDFFPCSWDRIVWKE